MKRYENREAIIRDIDSALKKISKAKKAAQENLDQEELLTEIPEQLSVLRQHRESADFQFRKIRRLENVRLPALKAKLAEFDTLALPGTLPDTGCSPASPQPPLEPVASSCDASSTTQCP